MPPVYIDARCALFFETLLTEPELAVAFLGNAAVTRYACRQFVDELRDCNRSARGFDATVT